MRCESLIVLVTVSMFAGCATHVPEPAVSIPGTPHVSWIIMSGDRDNPDREFVCQSEPRTECVVPVSRPDARVFSDVHIYYHGAGAETKYTGSIQVGFFNRLDTASAMVPSSGKTPVASLECTSSPSRLTSKHPPPPGISVSCSIFCLKLVSSAVVKLTAFGS